MKSLQSLSVLIFVWLLPGLGAATVGEPNLIEVLGYSPSDQKVYFMNNGAEPGLPLQLRFLSLGSDAPGRVRTARSWSIWAKDAHQVIRAKRAKLEARVVPMKPQLIEAELSIVHRGYRICGDVGQSTTDPKVQRQLILAHRRGEPRDMDSPVCEVLRVKVSWRGHTGAFTAESWGFAARIVSLHEIPDTQYALAIVRYVGVHFESGYERDYPLLLKLQTP